MIQFCLMTSVMTSYGSYTATSALQHAANSRFACFGGIKLAG